MQQPGTMHATFGTERIPVTIEAEVGQMTFDEALASGMFDDPGVPGAVRIPISVQVAIPTHLLTPAPTAAATTASDADAEPPAGTPSGSRRRFGNYPKAVAAQNIAKSIGSSIGDRNEAAALRDMARATGHPETAIRTPSQDEAIPGQGVRGNGHNPIQRVQYEPEDERAGMESREPDLPEQAREREAARASDELRTLEPRNRELTVLRAPDTVPDAAAVTRIEDGLTAAKARAAAKASPAGQAGAEPAPTRDNRDIETQLGFPPRVKPSTQAKAGSGPAELALPTPRLPSYRVGESDGGPGQWVGDSKRYPKSNPNAAAYQQLSTGAPQGTEYKVTGVSKSLMPSGEKYFDGYDPETRNLIDAKNYVDWPKESFKPSVDQVAKELRTESKVAADFGSTLEIRVATPEKAKALQNIIEEKGIPNTVVKAWPPG